jgi:hypothetical protein
MMHLFFELLAVLAFMVIAGLGLTAVYHLIMGGLQKDKKQLMLGFICLAGAVACTFIGLLFIAKIIKAMC